MELRFSKTMYSKQALIKAAYSFTNDYYVYLDSSDDYYLVFITAKNGSSEVDLENMFANEILFQTTRELVSKNTSNIRELILGRAFASTVVEKENSISVSDSVPNEDVFKDWYEKR